MGCSARAGMGSRFAFSLGRGDRRVECADRPSVRRSDRWTLRLARPLPGLLRSCRFLCAVGVAPTVVVLREIEERLSWLRVLDVLAASRADVLRHAVNTAHGAKIEHLTGVADVQHSAPDHA